MATNVINIREFVDVSTSVASTPLLVARDWGAMLFVEKGTDDQATVLVEYESLADVNERASNTEAATVASVFYGTSYRGITPTAKFYVATIGAKDDEQFVENFTALLGNEAYYLIVLDKAFTAAQNKAAASLMAGTNNDAAHKLFLDDHSVEAASLPLVALQPGDPVDDSSIAAYCFNNKLQHVMVIWSDPENTNKYYSAAAASYFSTRQFNASTRRMATLAHKVASGIAPINIGTDSISSTISATKRFQILDSKNANVYANIKVVGLSAWERGNTPSGDDMIDFISADYLNYRLSVAVFQLLQSVPALAMNQDGAVMLANVITNCFEELASAGIITGGVALDGDVIPAPGYKYSIPIPTGVAKANGLWEGIYCVALLTGSAKKVVIGNELKK